MNSNDLCPICRKNMALDECQCTAEDFERWATGEFDPPAEYVREYNRALDLGFHPAELEITHKGVKVTLLPMD